MAAAEPSGPVYKKGAEIKFGSMDFRLRDASRTEAKSDGSVSRPMQAHALRFLEAFRASAYAERTLDLACLEANVQVRWLPCTHGEGGGSGGGGRLLLLLIAAPGSPPAPRLDPMPDEQRRDPVIWIRDHAALRLREVLRRGG